MKKVLSSICIGLLLMSMLGGCTKSNATNKTLYSTSSQKMHTACTKNNAINKPFLNNSEEEVDKDYEDVFLMIQENYGVQRAWANAKEYFILNDILRDKPKIFVYKNNKLLYSIDNDINNNGLYENIFFNPSGDKFVCQKLDKSKKQWQLDIFNAEDGVKEETYFKQKNEHFVLLQWTEKGMIFRKYDGWEERSKLIPKLFMLNQQKEFQEIWDYSHTPYEVCDINGEWALLKNHDNKKFQKINLHTKEIKDTNFNYDLIETLCKGTNSYNSLDHLYYIYFYNSPNALVGQILYNDSYAIFLFKNEQMKIITENDFVGVTKDGVVYKKYTGDDGEGNIYVKLVN